MTPFLRWGFGASALLWAGLLPVAASIASRPEGPLGVLAAGIYTVGAFVCHQLPERSFHLAGVPWPVCARCTGIYMGASAGVILTLVTGPWGRSPFENDQSVARWRVVLAAGVLPSIATLILEWATGRMPGHWVRAVAGVPIGLLVSVFVLTTLRDERGSA